MATTLQLPFEGRVPSLEGATGWLNTEPITDAALSGRPLLIQFWTFTCINWIRTLPYIRAWYETYRTSGLVVIGVHTPEFDIERGFDAVERAAKRMGIEYPIAVDTDHRIWQGFGNTYWPAIYLVDTDGWIRHHHFGEADYERSAIALGDLVASATAERLERDIVSARSGGLERQADWSQLRSPETYIGYGAARRFSSPQGLLRDEPRAYSLPESLQLNQWALDGEWRIGHEAAVVNRPQGAIAFRFHARDAHLVLAPAIPGTPVRFRVLLDGKAPGSAHGLDVDDDGNGIIEDPRLYQLVRQAGRIDERTVRIAFPDAGVRAYAFSFG